jgi:hypothetical protein
MFFKKKKDAVLYAKLQTTQTHYLHIAVKCNKFVITNPELGEWTTISGWTIILGGM